MCNLLNLRIGLDLGYVVVCVCVHDAGLDHHHHQQQQQQQQVEVEVEEEVLAMAEELPLDTAELANQASRLLEEHDLTNVLNQIPADAFNDLFTGMF
jgi:hypothetical protein